MENTALKSTIISLVHLMVLVYVVRGENVGWKSYLEENPTEFHDLPLTWEPGSKVPDWLSGTYVRNGPAQTSFGSERRKMSSWLDGYAKLHSFKFNGENVLFSGKMLESPNYLASVEAGELVPQTTLNKFVNEDEEWTLWEKLRISTKVLLGTAFDNNNPVVWRLGEKSQENGIYLAMTDSPVPIRFNISDLSTLGMQYPNWFPLTLSGCAHFLREIGTDNSISFMGKKHLTGKPFIQVQRYTPQSTYQDPEVVGSFTPKKFSNVHSFSLTEEFAIFFFYPVIVNPKLYFSANFHVFELIQWLEGEMTDVFIVDLKTGNITQLETDPIYSVHHVNAYRANKDELILDLCPTSFANMRDYLKLENMLNPPTISTGVSTNKNEEFIRYTINLTTQKISHSYLPNPTNSQWTNHFDFPVINERFRGKKYCYVFGWAAFDYSRIALVKKNVCDGTQDKVWYVENHYSSEMWFLESPDPKSEDDGVLITVVFDGEKSKSYLVIIDAITFEPIARSYLPHNIPWSAHGMHFPEATFGASSQHGRRTSKDEL